MKRLYGLVLLFSVCLNAMNELMVYPGDIVKGHQIDPAATLRDRFSIEGQVYIVGRSPDVEQLAEDIAVAPLNQEKLDEVESRVQAINQREDIPPTCKAEVQLLLQERQDQLKLHQYKKEQFLRKNGSTIIQQHVLRTINSQQADKILQGMDDKAREALKKLFAKPAEQEIAQEEVAQKPEQPEEIELPELEEPEGITEPEIAQEPGPVVPAIKIEEPQLVEEPQEIVQEVESQEEIEEPAPSQEPSHPEEQEPQDWLEIISSMLPQEIQDTLIDLSLLNAQEQQEYFDGIEQKEVATILEALKTRADEAPLSRNNLVKMIFFTENMGKEEREAYVTFLPSAYKEQFLDIVGPLFTEGVTEASHTETSDAIEMLRRSVAIINQIITQQQLETLHDDVYQSVTSIVKAGSIHNRIMNLKLLLQNFLPEVVGMLRSVDPAIMTADTKELRPQLQDSLNRFLSYILVAFDACIAAMFDARENNKSMTLESVFSSEGQKRQRTISMLRSIRHGLTAIGDPLVDLIDLVVTAFLPLMDEQEAFENKQFNVMVYSHIKRLVTVRGMAIAQGARPTTEEEVYLYERTDIKEGRKITIISEWHKKNYATIIKNYVERVDKGLEAYGISPDKPLYEEVKPQPEIEEPKLQEPIAPSEPAVQEQSQEPKAEEQQPEVKPTVPEPSVQQQAEKQPIEAERTVSESIAPEPPVEVQEPTEPTVSADELGEQEQIQEGLSPEETLAEQEKDVNDIYDSIIKLIDTLMTQHDLRNLHTDAYGDKAIQRITNESKDRVQEACRDIKTTLPSLRDQLHLLYIEDPTPFISKDKIDALQEKLDVFFACMLITFDAFVAGIYDAKQVKLQTSGFWGLFGGGASEEEKIAQEIKQYNGIQDRLDALGEIIPNCIGAMVTHIMPYMNSKAAFNNLRPSGEGSFDVLQYGIVKKIRKPSVEDYYYGRVETSTEAAITKWHKKDYVTIINNYKQEVTRKLGGLIPVEEKAPAIESALRELEQPELAKPIEIIPPSQVAQEVIEKLEQQEVPQEEPQPVIQEPAKEPEQKEESQAEEDEQEAEEETEEQEEIIPAPAEPQVVSEALPVQQPAVSEPQPDPLQQEMKERAEREQIERQKFAAANAQLNQAIQTIAQRTQSLKHAQLINEETWLDNALSADDLNTLLAPLDIFTQLTIETAPIIERTQKLKDALTAYANQLIEMAFFKEPIGDYTLETLHTAAHEQPLKITEFYQNMQTFSTSTPVTLVANTLNAATAKGVTLILSSGDRVLALSCAVFDAFASGMMQPDILQKQEVESLVQAYTQAITDGSTFATVIMPLFDIVLPYTNQTTRDAYQAGTLDITTLEPALSAEDNYIYAVDADVSFNVGDISLKTVAIDALHKKEYDTVLLPLKTTLDAQQSLKTLQETVATQTNPTTETIDQQLAELETLKDAIDAETYAALKKQLEDAKQAAADVHNKLDTLFANFKAAIQEARTKLTAAQPIITAVSFDVPYRAIQTLLTSSALKEQYAARVEEMVTLFKNYITQAANTMISATGLNILHRAVQGKTVQARAAIDNAFNLPMITNITQMLNELKANALFGIDSAADSRTKEGRDLSTALIRGYAYIIVAFDALEATLYEDFSDQQKLRQWITYLWTAGEKGTETMYDKAIETLDQVMNVLNGLREQYYAKLIDPFFAGRESYKDAYEQNKLDVMLLGLEGVKNDEGNYRYARSGFTDTYKGQPFIVPAITSLHKRDYNSTMYWKEQVGSIYAPELLAKKQQEIIQAIQATNTPIPMTNLIDTFKDAQTRDLFAASLLLSAQQYPIITQMLQEYMQLYEKAMVKFPEQQPTIQHQTFEIQQQLEGAFKMLLGIYDGLFAYVYDVTQDRNKTTNTQDKKLYADAIAAVLTSVGPAIGQVIDSFQTFFMQYLSDDFKQKFNNQSLLIGEAIGATVTSDPKGLQHFYIFERPTGYTANYPQQGWIESKATYGRRIKEYVTKGLARLAVGDQIQSFFVPPQHKKLYSETLQAWQPMIDIIRGAQQQKQVEQLQSTTGTQMRQPLGERSQFGEE